MVKPIPAETVCAKIRKVVFLELPDQHALMMEPSGIQAPGLELKLHIETTPHPGHPSREGTITLASMAQNGQWIDDFRLEPLDAPGNRGIRFTPTAVGMLELWPLLVTSTEQPVPEPQGEISLSAIEARWPETLLRRLSPSAKPKPHTESSCTIL